MVTAKLLLSKMNRRAANMEEAAIKACQAFRPIGNL